MTAKLMNPKQKTQPCGQKKILLVEDNEMNRMLLSDFLRYCSYDVKTLADGEKFLLEVESFQPQLILLDLKLPDVDGYSLLAELQKNHNFKDIPIIVVSAFAFKMEQEKAFSLGARRYFVKPINLNQLIIAIEQELKNFNMIET
jgi:two-component system, cell cycle response regulator DivK